MPTVSGVAAAAAAAASGGAPLPVEVTGRIEGLDSMLSASHLVRGRVRARVEVLGFGRGLVSDPRIRGRVRVGVPQGTERAAPPRGSGLCPAMPPRGSSQQEISPEHPWRPPYGAARHFRHDTAL